MTNELVLDLETSIHDKGSPFHPDNFVVSAHRKHDSDGTTCIFYTSPDFVSAIRSSVSDARLLIGVNLKFDIHWLSRLEVNLPDKLRVWDCMIAEYVLSGQTNSFASLASLCELYGLEAKHEGINEWWDKGISTEDVPQDIVADRGNSDVELTHLVYKCQLSDPRMTPELHKLILLKGLDLLVLQEMEYNGFKYDSDNSMAKAVELNKEIDSLRNELNSYSPVPINFASGDQLSYFLFGGVLRQDVFNPVTETIKSGPNKGKERTINRFSHTEEHKLQGFFKPIPDTEIKKSTPDNPIYQTSDEILSKLKATTKVQRSIIAALKRLAELEKLVGTYLEALPKLIKDKRWQDNYIHGQFNQVQARTGRLSSSRPNMQNVPSGADIFFISRYD